MERIINKVKGLFTVMYVDKDTGWELLLHIQPSRQLKRVTRKSRLSVDGWTVRILYTE